MASSYIHLPPNSVPLVMIRAQGHQAPNVKEAYMNRAWKGKIITKQAPSGELVRLMVLERELRREKTTVAGH